MNHIALLLPDLEVGGAQRVMLMLAREFSERGFKVDIVSLSDFGPLQASIPPGVNLVNLGAKKYGFGLTGFLASSVFLLAKWVKKENPPVLLSSINGANLAVLLTRKISKISSRIVIREAASVVFSARGIRLHAMRWLYPGADCVIALHPVMVKEMTEIVGVPEEIVRCIPNPIDVKFISEQAKLPLEHSWANLEGQQKLIVSVGRLVPKKDYVTLIKAFALLPDSLDARLIIVGEGRERDKLERLMEKFKVADRVQLVGFDANPWRWVTRAHVFVLSSCSEGYPNSLLEAVALGVPAITTEYDASVRDLEGKYNLGVVKVGDEKELAKIIEEQLLAETLPRVDAAAEKDKLIDAYLNALERANQNE